MFFGGSLFALVALALWIYCILDAISTDESLIQHLPKIVWLLIVIFVPTVGSVAWLVLGRPRGASFTPGGKSAPSSGYTGGYTGRAVSAPEIPPLDPAEYQRRREEALRRYEEERDEAGRKKETELEAIRLQAWEEELRRREDELRQRKVEGDPGVEPGGPATP